MSVLPTLPASIEDLFRYDPSREVTWRFDRVLQMTDKRWARAKPCKTYDDQYVRTARAFILQWRMKSPEYRPYLYPEFPGIYHAYGLHTSRDELVKHILQARLLAGQSDQEIARSLHLTPQCVHWYEAVFFNVRDRLEAKDWVVRAVLGPAVERGVVQRPWDATLKLFGYFHGPVMLDFMISGFQSVGKPTSPEEVTLYLNKYVEGAVKRRAAYAIDKAEINRFNIVPLLMLHQQLVADERAEKMSGAAKSFIEKNVESLLELTPFVVGRTQANAGNTDGLPYYDGGAAELRDSEMYEVQLGRVSETVKAVPAKILRIPAADPSANVLPQEGS